ncbi:MAG: HAD family phosphatase [Chloroflexi bacterium AL-N5]|nr:HAD family phosphatase [Chloroflexi bacterium AL-N5]
MTILPLADAFPRWPSSLDLIATDMDGTLTLDEEITGDLLQALQDLRQAGITVLITTGRSAGWVNGLAYYLPIVGAIAENGGLFYSPHLDPAGVLLSPIQDRLAHRHRLAEMFAQLQAEFPFIEEASDNGFRVTDWTYTNPGFVTEDLHRMKQICREAGWGFVYSNVQCHIKPLRQNKQTGLLEVLSKHLSLQRRPDQLITIGDSPNDDELFDPAVFPYSVGVANVADYLDDMQFEPVAIATYSEQRGFLELAQLILNRGRSKG